MLLNDWLFVFGWLHGKSMGRYGYSDCGISNQQHKLRYQPYLIYCII